MILSAKAVRLAYAFAAKQDIRYYLNGVNVEPAKGGGAIITGTDGRRVVQVLDREASNVEPVIMKLDAASQAFLKRGEYVSTEFEEKRVAILNADRIPMHLQFEHFAVDGKYPDVAKVLGKREDWQAGIAGTFNVELISDVARLVEQARVAKRYGHPAGLTLFSKVGESGRLLEADGFLFIIDGSEVRAWGRVMPMRATLDDPLEVVFGKAA
jgi:hypothetical protein